MCCASADSVVIVPATPTQVRARSTGTTPQRLPQRVAHHRARGGDLDGGRRVGVQAAFGQPHAADVGGEAGLHPPRRSPSTTSVEPPPRSTTTKGAAAASNSPTAPWKDSSASSVPVITSATAPGTTAPSTSDGHREELVAVGGVPGGRRRDHPHPGTPSGAAARRRSRPAPPGCGPARRARIALWRRHPDPAGRCASRGARRAADRRPRRRSAAGSSWCRSRSRRPCSRPDPSAPGCPPSPARSPAPPAPRRRTD